MVLIISGSQISQNRRALPVRCGCAGGFGASALTCTSQNLLRTAVSAVLNLIRHFAHSRSQMRCEAFCSLVRLSARLRERRAHSASWCVLVRAVNRTSANRKAALAFKLGRLYIILLFAMYIYHLGTYVCHSDAGSMPALRFVTLLSTVTVTLHAELLSRI